MSEKETEESSGLLWWHYVLIAILVALYVLMVLAGDAPIYR